jgi:hypothetical protein
VLDKRGIEEIVWRTLNFDDGNAAVQNAAPNVVSLTFQ